MVICQKEDSGITLYNLKKAAIRVGQGPVGISDSTRQLGPHILEEKNIHAWVDFWGYDCAHDWYWWYEAGGIHFCPIPAQERLR